MNLSFGAELYGVQDGGRLNFSNPQSFRAILVEGTLSYDFLDKLSVSARGGTTFSVEGGIGAPIDPRLWTAFLEGTARPKLGTFRLRVGHDGSAGGWAAGIHLDVPIPGAPDLVADYSYPFQKALGEAPWVVTAGMRVNVGKLSLAKLF
jgi:hypothetical protein